MVDMLYSVLLCIDMEWDATYASIDETRMSETLSDRHLTAARFNSFRHNINRCVGCLWLWQTEKDREGYTGRLDMHGAKTHGRDADIVRGWYLDELVFIMNILIRAWRGDADAVSAFEALHNAIAPRKVGFDVFDLRMISIMRNSITRSEKNLQVFPLVLERMFRSSASQIRDEFETYPLIRAQSFSAVDANVHDRLDVLDAIFHKSIHAANMSSNSFADVFRIENLSENQNAVFNGFENLNCYDVIFEKVKKSMERLSNGNADVLDIVNLYAFENVKRKYFGNIDPLDIDFLKQYRNIQSIGTETLAVLDTAMIGAVENSSSQSVDRLSVLDIVFPKAIENSLVQYGAWLDCLMINNVADRHIGIMRKYANIEPLDVRYLSALSNMLYQDFARFEPKSIVNMAMGGNYGFEKCASVFFPTVINPAMFNLSESSMHGLLYFPSLNNFKHGGISASDFKGSFVANPPLGFGLSGTSASDFKGSFSFPQIKHELLASNRKSLMSASLGFLYQYTYLTSLRGISKSDFVGRLEDFGGNKIALKSSVHTFSNSAMLRIDNHLRFRAYPYHAAAVYNTAQADVYRSIMLWLTSYHANARWGTPSVTIHDGIICEVNPYHANAIWEIPNMTTHDYVDMTTSDKNAKVVSSASVEAIRGYARFEDVYSNAKAQGIANIDKFSPDKMSGTESNSKSASSAMVDGIEYASAAVLNPVKRKSRAAMRIIRTEVEWYDPIEEGDNLHFRSVWSHDESGDNVHIG